MKRTIVTRRLVGAGGVELDLAVRGEETPVLLILHLAVVTLGIGLPGLIEGLEVEQINTPVEHATDTSLPECFSILGTGLGSLVVRAAIGGPAGLTGDNVDLVGVVAGDLLDVLHGAGHVIEVGLVGLVGGSTLPVSKGVGQATERVSISGQSCRFLLHFHLHICHNGLLGEQGVASAVSKLIPALGGADKDSLRHIIHHMADISVELGSGQVTTVESLGSDGDRMDDVLITGDGLLDSSPVSLEGRLLQQIIGIGRLANPKEVKSVKKNSSD